MSTKIESVNPSTGKLLKKHETISEKDLNSLLDSSSPTFESWRKTYLETRSAFIEQVKEITAKNRNLLVETMTREMGKPLVQAKAEIKKCESLCDYYVGLAKKELEKNQAPWTKLISTDHESSYTLLKPKGAILGIMPWNFPFWQVFRFAIPNLLVGNTVFLKHAPNTQMCAAAIEGLFQEATQECSLGENSPYQNLCIQEDEVERVLEHPLIQGVSLTGSTNAGKAVASMAGAQMKKSVFELGGSDPYLILEDADLDRAAKLSVKSRLINSGQSCIAAKRFIVHKNVATKFKEKVVQELKSYKIGDPLEESTQVGPLARKDLLEKLEKQVKDSLKAGAHCLYESDLTDLPSDEGFFSPIRLLDQIKPDNPAFQEELFGPVAVLIEASSEEEMIQLTNKSPYGLGAAVFSEDLEKARRLAHEEIQSGAVSINDFVRSDPRLPFGGVKESGYGRELSEEGLFEFANLKTITED